MKEQSYPLGHEQITSLSSAATLTIPDNKDNDVPAHTAVIRCQTQGVRWRDDGTAPTASIGMPLSPGDVLTYTGALNKLQFIEQAASATLNVAYYE